MNEQNPFQSTHKIHFNDIDEVALLSKMLTFNRTYIIFLY